MGERPPQLLLGHLLVGHRLHHVRPGHEHVGGVLHHEDEVGHRRGIDRAPRARPHYERDLGDHPGGEHVALEDVRVAGEGRYPLLDARPSRIVEAHHRGAQVHRLIHHLADLAGVGGGERAAEDGEVLAEGEDAPAVHEAVADHHSVAGDPLLAHAEVVGIVLDEHVPLFERPLVEEEIEAFAGGQLALGVLGSDSPLPAPRGARHGGGAPALGERPARGAEGCAVGRRPVRRRGARRAPAPGPRARRPEWRYRGRRSRPPRRAAARRGRRAG